MKQKPVVIEWFAVAFVGGSNVACRQCDDAHKANAQCQAWKAENPNWTVKVRRVVRVSE